MAELKETMKVTKIASYEVASTKNVVGQDGILRSSNDEQFELNTVNGSFYIQLMQTLNQTLKDKRDWIWMKNCLTGDVLLGSDIQNIVKRYQLYSFKSIIARLN